MNDVKPLSDRMFAARNARHCRSTHTGFKHVLDYLLPAQPETSHDRPARRAHEAPARRREKESSCR